MGVGTLLSVFNPKGLVGFSNDLYHQYGLKFTLMMTSNYFGLKGALRGFLDNNETGFYRSQNYPVSANSLNTAIAKLPWAIKGLGGLLSDLFPIFGYEKSSYMLLYSLLGAASLLCLTLIEFEYSVHGSLPAVFFFLVQLQVSFCDLLMEGKYVDLMKDYPQSRGNIITFSYFCITAGGLIPSALVGVFTDILESPRIIFWMAFPFCLQAIPFILTGCVIRDKAIPSRNNKFDFFKFKLQLPIMVLAIVMTLAAFGSFGIGLTGNTDYSFYYALTASVVLNLAAFIALPVVVANLNFYLFLGQTLYLQIQPILDYFFLASDECFQDGPQFSFTFLKTVIPLLTQVGKFIGLWLFQAVFTRWFKYREIFWVSSLLRCLASLFDLAIVNRWNIAIGIPDHFFYLFGHAIVYEITYMLDFLPFTLMIAKICPINIEVTLFALLAGFANYGASIGAIVATKISNALGIYSTQTGPCNFDNLNWLVVISNLAFPSLLIPLAFFFVPAKRVGENIADTTFENSRYLFSAVKYYRVEYEGQTRMPTTFGK